MTHAGAAFDAARARVAAYRSHGKPSARAEHELMLLGMVGWTTLRGRGKRRLRLRRAIDQSQRERPELFDFGYRRVGDTLRVKHLHLLTWDWLEHLRTTPQRWQHVQPLPTWARDAYNGVPTSSFEEHGKRWRVARDAASAQIIASQIGIAFRTVKRRLHERITWVPVEARKRVQNHSSPSSQRSI